MKKRNQPFILLTALVLLLGSVAFFNMMGSKKPDDAHDHSDQEALAGHSSEAAPNARAEMERKAAEAINKKDGTGMKVATTGKPLPDYGPMVKNPATYTYQQKPNENATSSQWYQDNSGRK